MISQKNKDNCIEKWEGIIKTIEDGKDNPLIIFNGISFRKKINETDSEHIISVYGDCGFCIEYRNRDADEDENQCEHCPLYIDDFCVNSPPWKTETNFWHIVHDLERDNKQYWDEALKESKNLLERIKEEPIDPSVICEHCAEPFEPEFSQEPITGRYVCPKCDNIN